MPNNCGVMALITTEGIATSMGHSPVAALLDPVAGIEPPLARLYRILFGLLSKVA
jgi:phosphoribosylformylglycinamidine synthase